METPDEKAVKREPVSEYELFANRRYKSMLQRFQPKYTPDGRCYQLGTELPFSPAEFLDWIKKVFREGVARCVYCDWPVSLQTVHLDHRIPVCQGGALELFNLAPACAECNAQKGEMTDGAFLELRALITNHPKFEGITRVKFTPHDAAYIKGCLQSSLKLAKWKQRRIAAEEKVRIVPHRHEVRG